MMLKDKKTYVAFVLDRSGSMFTIQDAVVSGINEQIDVIKGSADKAGETLVSLVTFSTDNFWSGEDSSAVKTIFANKPASLLKHITVEEYAPNGGTPMYDGVGYTLDLLSDLDNADEDVAFLVIVVSDGMENASRKYTATEIADRVKKLEATGRWTFSYIGANQDLKQVQEQTGFSGVAYAANSAGTKQMFGAMASTNNVYFDMRSAGASAMLNYTETLASTLSEEKTDEK